jgi:outer membrane murein-binding lipoprotein Lpp
MRKQFAKIILGAALTGAALLAPITSEAKTSRMTSVQTTSGKTVQLRTMKVGGQMMILVPMSMACDVFHVYC